MEFEPWDEDFEYEFTDEFSQAINELVKNEVVGRMQGTVEELEQKKQENENLRETIKDLRRQGASYGSDLKKSLKEKELEVKRELFDGFAPGDTAYTSRYKSDSKDCEMCKGDRKAIASIEGKETKVRCPSCNGYGHISRSWLEPEQIKIRNVQMELTVDGNKYLKFFYGYDYNETKVLFKTVEECQAYCDSKNKEKG